MQPQPDPVLVRWFEAFKWACPSPDEFPEWVAVGSELAAEMRLIPGGAAFLDARRARWRTEPAQSATRLVELLRAPVQSETAEDTRPWPGQYL